MHQDFYLRATPSPKNVNIPGKSHLPVNRVLSAEQ